jgi:uncharacterized protein
MEYLGYILATLVGISLGLVGSGGSILAMPILVYIFGVEPILATTYSLFIVGMTALVGGVKNYFSRNVDLKTALFFGLSSVISVLLVRRFLLTMIPDNLFSIGNFILTKNIFIMVLFAIFMIAASYNMIKPIAVSSSEKSSKIQLFLLGILVGALTGILGAGGGFLIIPALILFANLEMKKAVGTSLIIIAANALIGFFGSMNMNRPFEFDFLFLFTCLSIIGMFIGIYLSKKIDGTKLKTGFGWFILAMGLYILVKELIF